MLQLRPVGSPGYAHPKVMAVAREGKTKPTSPYQAPGPISAVVPLAEAHGGAQSEGEGKGLPLSRRRTRHHHGEDADGAGARPGHERRPPLWPRARAHSLPVLCICVNPSL